MANNPIQSHDLYTPGPQDTLAALKRELVAIQEAVRALDDQARSLKKVLASGVTSPAKVVSAATEADRIASAKRVLIAREAAQMQRIHNQTLKQAAIAQQQVAAATSRANIARQREIDYANRAANANKKHHTSLTGLIGSIRNLAYAYFTLGAASQIFQNILKQTKALDTLTVAFNTTLGSTQATAQAQEYLLDISERFGANLLGASQAYLKFSAASTQAGVSAEETQKIFTSVTKASSILGLGAERTSYVFLALEQIMSKGRLSTEELRRQLGEHLPGAFGIAAEAMGVTTAKLTDMLKKGQIASTDFLPKFAAQLEKAYGIDQVERIDNLAAAQERFNNELTLLVKELDLSGVFKDFFNTLSSGVKFVRENVDAFLSLGKAILYVGAAWAAFKIGAVITGLRQMTTATLALNAAFRANPIGIVATAAILLYGAIDILTKKYKDANKEVDAFAEGQKEIEQKAIEANKTLNAQAEALRRGNIPASERKRIIDDMNAALGPYLDKLLTEESSYEEIKIALDKANSSLATRVSLLKLENEYVALKDEEAKINEELANSAIEIAKAEALINAEKEKFAKLDKIGKDTNIKVADETVNALVKQSDLVTKYNQLLEDRRKKELRLVDIQEEYRKLSGEKLIIPGDDTIITDPDPDGPKGKDPRLEALDRLAELNKIEKDSLDKRIADATIAYQKEKLLQEISLEEKKINEAEYNEFVTALREKFYRDLFQIENEYYNDELDGYNANEQRTKETIEKLSKFWADFYKGLADGAEKQREDFRKTNDAAQEIIDDVKGFFRGISKSQREEETDIFSLLGISFDNDNQKQAVVDSLDFAKEQLTDFLDFQKEIIDQQIEDADRLVREKEENLNRQIALAAANQANNVAGAQAELALAKKTQEEALKQRQKFQKTELALNTALEASNLGVAIAKTLAANLGLAGIGLVALMLGAFAAAKIKAFQLVNKKTFRKGGFEQIGGGSHESGRDTHVGGGNYAERGESVGIFTNKATRKYKPTLKALVNAANKGTLENILIQDRRAIQGINMVNKTDVDTSLMEKRLTRLVSLSESKTFVDGRGRLVRIDRGRKTIINR